MIIFDIVPCLYFVVVSIFGIDKNLAALLADIEPVDYSILFRSLDDRFFRDFVFNFFNHFLRRY